jgi:hypothetical protein
VHPVKKEPITILAELPKQESWNLVD